MPRRVRTGTRIATLYTDSRIEYAYGRVGGIMRLFLSAATCAAIAALLVASGSAQSTREGGSGFAGPVLTALPTTGWPTNGGNLYNQRYSPLKAIDRTNVARLKGVWR